MLVFHAHGVHVHHGEVSDHADIFGKRLPVQNIQDAGMHGFVEFVDRPQRCDTEYEFGMGASFVDIQSAAGIDCS